MPYIGREPLIGAFLKLDSLAASFNSACTTFTLTSSGTPVVPGSAQNLIISYNGVLQEPVTAYGVSGTSIIFTTAPATGATFFAVMLGQALDVGTVSPDIASALTVNTAMFLAGNTVTTNSTVLTVGSTSINSTATVFGGTYAGINKPREQTITSNTTITPSFDTADIVTVTALAANTTIANATPVTTVTQGSKFTIRIKDNGTARTLTWGAQYRSMGATLPTTTTINKTMYMGLVWNATDSKWDLMALAQES